MPVTIRIDLNRSELFIILLAYAVFVVLSIIYNFSEREFFYLLIDIVLLFFIVYFLLIVFIETVITLIITLIPSV